MNLRVLFAHLFSLLRSLAARPLRPYVWAYVATISRFGVFYPWLVLHLKESGLLDSQIPLILLAIAVPSLVVQQVWGYVADIVLTRRHTLMILFPAAAATYTLFFVLHEGIPGLSPLATFLLLGFLFGCVNSPIAQMLNGLVFGDPNASPHFSALRATGSMGFAVVLLGLGFVIEYGDAAYSLSAWAFVALSVMGIAGVAMAPCYQGARLPREQRLSFRRVQAILARNPRIAGILVFVLLYEAAFTISYYSLHPLLVKGVLNAGEDVQAVIPTIGALAEIPFFLTGDLMIRRIGAMRCLFIAAVANVARWMATYFATQPWHVVALSPLHAITFGMFYFGVVRYMNKHTDERLRASTQTLLGIVFYGLSTIIGNFAASYLLEDVGLSVRDCYLVTSLAATVALVYLAIFWVYDKALDRRAAEAEAVRAPA